MLFEEFAIFAIISAAYIIRLVQTYILSNSIKAEKLSAVKCTMKDKLWLKYWSFQAETH